MSLAKIMKKTVQKSMNKFGYEIVKQRRGVDVNYHWLDHFVYFKEIYDLIKDVDGDLVECGIGSGKSFFKLCFLAYKEGKNRKIYGFDSFEGFPEPTKEDDSPRNPKKGEWKRATIQSIFSMLKDKGQFDNNFIDTHVKLIKGYFEDTVQQYSNGKIAFLHLDVDLYNSYKVTLEHFWPMVVKGGIVLFDEYKQPNALRNFPGASKAIDEFFGEDASKIKHHKAGNKYYMIKE